MVDRRVEVLEEMYARSNDENYELLSALSGYQYEDKPFLPQEVIIRIPVHNFGVSGFVRLESSSLHCYHIILQSTTSYPRIY